MISGISQTSLNNVYSQDPVASAADVPDTDSSSNANLVDLTAFADKVLADSAQYDQNLADLNAFNSPAQADQVTASLAAQEASVAEQQQQLALFTQQALPPEQLATVNAVAADYQDQFNEGSQLLASGNTGSFNRLMTSMQPSLAAQAPTASLSTDRKNESMQISAMADNASFFSLLITVMLFGYNASSDYGKVMLLKQKDAQATASTTTDWQKFFLELKGLVNNDKLSDKDMYSLFKDSFGPNPNQDVKNVLGKYQDMFDMSGMKWDGSDTDKAQFNTMLNASIDQANQKLINNGVTKGSTLSHFDSTDYSNDDNKTKLLAFCDSQGKTCENSSSQLTTINQNLQASVSQTTETIKSLLEWLKTSIQGYGTAINPR